MREKERERESTREKVKRGREREAIQVQGRLFGCSYERGPVEAKLQAQLEAGSDATQFPQFRPFRDSQSRN